MVLNGDGTVTFTPNANFNGAASFIYNVATAAGASNTGDVTVNVAAVNDAPVAGDGHGVANVAEDLGARTIPWASTWLLGNDTDVDNLVGPLNAGLSISAVSGAVSGARLRSPPSAMWCSRRPPTSTVLPPSPIR